MVVTSNRNLCQVTLIDAVNKTSLCWLAVSIFVLFGLNAGYAQDRDTVWVWYGNPNNAPIQAQINDTLYVDVYVETGQTAYVGDMLLALGARSQYIDTLISSELGQVFEPLTQWQFTGFGNLAGSPPNPSGWFSESFFGWATLYGSGVWLHVGIPWHVLTMVARTVNDPSLLGQTVTAFGPGQDPLQGPSNAGDTLGGPGYVVVEHHSLVEFIQETGFVNGTVTDDNADAIEGVSVTAVGIDDTVTTDSNGEYSIELATDIYTFSFSHPGYNDTTIAGVVIALDSTTILDVQMNPLPGGYVSGTIVDSAGFAIDGVIVTDSENTDFSTSNSQGEYVLRLPQGIYDIQFSHATYFDTTVTDISVDVNDTTYLDIVMAYGVDYPDDAPENIEVHQNYPNPFNQGTTIEFELERPLDVVIEIFDVQGRKVETVASIRGQVGLNHVKWDSEGSASGIYFCRVRSESSSESRAMLLIK